VDRLPCLPRNEGHHSSVGTEAKNCQIQVISESENKTFRTPNSTSKKLNLL
jgi:hypothetical protein